MKKHLLGFLVLFLVVSCKEDTTPSWLKIDAINLSTDEVSEGSNSHKIVDAWIYMDGTPIGVFELPCKVPILAEGEHSFLIYAGIQQNGISASRTRYPFYDRYEAVINLTKGEVTTINPTVYYKKNLTFELKEDFEDTGIVFQKSIGSDTSIVFIDKISNPDIVKYGNRCGGIFLTQTDSIFKAQTATFLDLPKNEEVYLEFDYMNNNTMVTSTISQNSLDYVESDPLAGIQAQPFETMVWQKLYVPLMENVSFYSTATSYEIYLLSVLDPGNTQGVIYIDNIKVIRYQ